MENTTRQMTEYELECERTIKAKDKQIAEMQEHIKCLKDKLEEIQENKVELPIEPIKVADMLISAKETRTHCLTGKKYDRQVYEKCQLEQIAVHLLVYCNDE